MSVAGTLSLSDAACGDWDAAVVGAGPAGSVVAGLMAQAGARVLLIDRAEFPRAKVCGCCLNGRALSALGDAGLGGWVESLGGVPLASFALSAGRRTARVPLPAGVAVSREAFDAALVRAAILRGAAFLPGTRAAREGDGLRLIQPASSAVIRTRVTLAADGLGSSLLQRSGVPNVAGRGSRIGLGAVLASTERFYQAGVIYMRVGVEGYVGLVRLEDGRLDVASALDPVAVRHAAHPGEVIESLLDAGGWPVPSGLDTAHWRGTPPLTRQASRVAGERLFALGDATGYVEPFTGEGMAWALTSAVALAPLALEAAGGWRPDLAHAWERLHRRTVRRRQWMCRLAANVLRRPWLAALVVRAVGWLPELAGPAVRRLNAPVRPGRPRQSVLRELP